MFLFSRVSYNLENFIKKQESYKTCLKSLKNNKEIINDVINKFTINKNFFL